MKPPETQTNNPERPPALDAALGSAVKRSRVYLAAWMAAEKALPPESMRLIEDYDTMHVAHRKAGWPSPTPQPLLDAAKKIEADPLASIAFELRRKCNMESHEEWIRRESAERPSSGVAVGGCA